MAVVLAGRRRWCTAVGRRCRSASGWTAGAECGVCRGCRRRCRRRPAVVRTGVVRVRQRTPGGATESEAGGTAAAQQRRSLCGVADGGGWRNGDRSARQQRASGRRSDGGGRQVLAEFGENVCGGGRPVGAGAGLQRIAGMGQLVAGLVTSGAFVESLEGSRW